MIFIVLIKFPMVEAVIFQYYYYYSISNLKNFENLIN